MPAASDPSVSAVPPGDVEHVGLLVFMASQRGPLELNSVYLDQFGDYAVQSPPRPAVYTFRYRGILFTVSLTPRVGGFHYSVKAKVGHVPYTAQNLQGRLNALAILDGAKELSFARLVQDGHQAIWVRAETDLEGPMLPPAVMEQTLRVVQEVRPFLDLLGDYV